MAARVRAMEAVGPDDAIPTMTASFRSMALARSPARCGASGPAVPTAVGVSSITRPPELVSGSVKALPLGLEFKSGNQGVTRPSQRALSESPEGLGGRAGGADGIASALPAAKAARPK